MRKQVSRVLGSILAREWNLQWGWWEPLIYSRWIRSTGNNLDLRLVSDMEAAFWGWGLGPWNRSLSRGRGPQSWVEFVHLESENGVLVWGSLHTCPGTGSGDPKAIPTPIPPPSFLLTVLKVMEVKQVKGRKEKLLRLKKERETMNCFGFCF